MKIAVVFEGEILEGGGFQQQLSTIIELQKFKEYNFIAFVFTESNKNILQKKGIETVVVKNNFFDRVVRYVNRQDWYYPLCSVFKVRSDLEKEFNAKGIDLVYFLAPTFRALDLIDTNFIMTDWDLSHRDTPEFPEVNFYREFELREQLYTKSLKKAVAIIVDSEHGKENVVRRYAVDQHRVYPVSFRPAESVNDSQINVDVKHKYKVDAHYIYYPAQFWAHKNHVYIIDAIETLKAKGIRIEAVFSGADKGNLEYVLKYAKVHGVEDQVKYIGFAPDEEIYSLYKNSLAMVMPSYFGPTNIPPLEAFLIGTPVVYSDLPGLREQVGEAALLCDLSTPDSLVNKIELLIENGELRELLIKKGKTRLEELSSYSISDALREIFELYRIKLKCWKSEEGTSRS